MKNYRIIDDTQLRILEKSTIECGDVEEVISDYIDHELISTLQGRVAFHIKHCDHCSQAEEDMRMVVELAAILRDAPVPADVSRRLREGLNRRLGIELPLA